MSELRDYQAWHHAYDDPDSDLSWRLSVVRRYLEEVLTMHAGPLRVLSVCSGDGRDILGVLAGRTDADRVQVTLLEVDAGIAQAARDAAAAAELVYVEVRTVDAGSTNAYTNIVPADVVILVGVFGNISDADLHRTIAAAPAFCRPGGMLLWSRGRDRSDRNDEVRQGFIQAGFTEIDYAVRDTGSRPAIGIMRYDGPSELLTSDQRLFTFLR